MFAGIDVLMVSSWRRLSAVDSEVRVPSRPLRKVAVDPYTVCGNVPGDTNNDCVCDVSDIQFLQLYTVGVVTATGLTPAQLKEMEVNLDREVDGVATSAT